MQSFIIIALAFTGVGLGSYALLDFVTGEDRKVKRVLGSLTAYEAAQVSAVQPTLQPFKQRVAEPVWRGIVGLARRLWPPDYRQRLRRRIQAAGRPAGVDENGFMVAKAFTPLVAAVILVPAAIFCLITGSRLLALVALVLVPVSFWLPDAWLNGRTRARAHQIRRALPDMLDMLTISVEAGLGFDAALTKLVQNTTGPLSEEFDLMLREIQAGLPRQDALRNLADRTQVGELSAFITAVTQADVFGVSVSSVLRTQADDMRLRRRQAAEELAQKASVKMVFPVVVFILPATMLVVVGPAILSIGKAFGMM